MVHAAGENRDLHGVHIIFHTLAYLVVVAVAAVDDGGSGGCKIAIDIHAAETVCDPGPCVSWRRWGRAAQ